MSHSVADQPAPDQLPGTDVQPGWVIDARARFSSLAGDFVFLDAPGGTQTPDEVAAAVARVYREASGNLGAPYATQPAARGAGR